MHDPIHTTECEVMYTHAYVLVDIPNTNTRACLARIPTFIPVHNAHTCPTTTHSCEQAMYCTHVSVWSVELWASAAAMCCAPSSPMKLSSRLCAHVCVSRTIHHTCVAHECAIPPMRTCMSTYLIQTRVHAWHVYLPSFQCTTQYIPCTHMPR
jgi:hypothetical protein